MACRLRTAVLEFQIIPEPHFSRAFHRTLFLRILLKFSSEVTVHMLSMCDVLGLVAVKTGHLRKCFPYWLGSTAYPSNNMSLPIKSAFHENHLGKYCFGIPILHTMMFWRWLGGSVRWNVLYTKRLWVWSLVRAHRGGSWWMFLSHNDVSLYLLLPSLSQINKTYQVRIEKSNDILLYYFHT